MSDGPVTTTDVVLKSENLDTFDAIETPWPRDYRDLAIETLSEDILRAEAGYVDALRDAEAYRALAQRAIEALAAQHVEREQSQKRHQQLLEEHRRLADQYPHLREQTMREVA
ncbi:MAG: hypothetical protein GEV06_09370 [Luteitalea sp.]|nr:hypothetical protein [Luteitalea sp.]